MFEMAKAKILVVDDDVSLRAMFCEMLEAEGYEVETATNGRDALQQLDSHPVEAALVDMMMPVMDGLELCRKLREVAATSSLPIILMSAGSNVVSKAREVQATAALVKPFDMDGLLDLIDQLLARPGNGGSGSDQGRMNDGGAASRLPSFDSSATRLSYYNPNQRFIHRFDD